MLRLLRFGLVRWLAELGRWIGWPAAPVPCPARQRPARRRWRHARADGGASPRASRRSAGHRAPARNQAVGRLLWDAAPSSIFAASLFPW